MTNRERMIQDINDMYIGARYKIDNRYYICKHDNLRNSYFLESDDLIQEKYQNYMSHLCTYNLKVMLLFWGRNGFYKSIELVRE